MLVINSRPPGLRYLYAAVAGQRGMRLAGIVDLPTCAPDDTPDKLIVKSWADK